MIIREVLYHPVMCWILNHTHSSTYNSTRYKFTKLSVQFSQNLLAETNDFEIILDQADLAGLPSDIVDLAKLEAENKFSKNKDNKYKNKYVFTVQRSSMYPFLTYSTRRDLREKLYKSYHVQITEPYKYYWVRVKLIDLVWMLI